MENKVLTYAEAKKEVFKFLKGKNITEFCRNNQLDYNQVMQVKNVDAPKRIGLMSLLLKATGNTVAGIEKEILFHLKTTNENKRRTIPRSRKTKRS